MTKLALALVAGAGLLAVAGAALADDLPKAVTENKNTLVTTHKDKLKIETSSTYADDWKPENLLDGDLKTSWFTESNDSAAKGTTPSVTITFPEDVTVKRVTVAGNRDPNYPLDYSILKGTLEFLDADGKKLWKEEVEAEGAAFDFEFKPKDAVKKVRSIKFISTKDQGDKNDFGDVALGEFLIE